MKQLLISDYQVEEDTYGDTLALCKIAFHYFNERADYEMNKSREKSYIIAALPIIIGLAGLMFAAFIV